MKHRLTRFGAKLSGEHPFDRIIGSSEALRQAVEYARKIAASLLLTGKIGTNREIFSQAIHHTTPHVEEAVEGSCIAPV